MGADDGEGRGGLETFCRREFPRLVGALSLYCGDAGVAEDLAQETLARVWENWERVAGMERPDLWARRVAFNLAASWHRRQRGPRRRGWVVLCLGEEMGRVEGDAEFARLVKGLSPRERAVVVLRFYEDLSVADTAGLLGVREGTVRALTARAVARLRVGVEVEELG